MNATTLHARHSTKRDVVDSSNVEQLTLLSSTSPPARFRLSKDTRERGLRHVAEIREMLAARAASRGSVVDAASHRDQAA